MKTFFATCFFLIFSVSLRCAAQAPELFLNSLSFNSVSLSLSSSEAETLLLRSASEEVLLTFVPEGNYTPGDFISGVLVLESASGVCEDASLSPGNTYYYRAWSKNLAEEYSEGSACLKIETPSLPLPELTFPSFENGTLDEERVFFSRPKLDNTLRLSLDLATSSDFLEVPNLFFSEYGKGSGDNRYLEIYNPTAHAINLSNCFIALYENGKDLASSTLNLEGEIPARQTFLVCNNKAEAALTNLANLISARIKMTGNDAVLLFRGNACLDAIGKVGEDPGTGWDIGETPKATSGHTLVRKANIGYGSPLWEENVLTWEVRGKDDFYDLQNHVCNYPSQGTILEKYRNITIPEVGLSLSNLELNVNYFARARAEIGSAKGAYGPTIGPFALLPEPALQLFVAAALALLRRRAPSQILRADR